MPARYGPRSPSGSRIHARRRRRHIAPAPSDLARYNLVRANPNRRSLPSHLKPRQHLEVLIELLFWTAQVVLLAFSASVFFWIQPPVLSQKGEQLAKTWLKLFPCPKFAVVPSSGQISGLGSPCRIRSTCMSRSSSEVVELAKLNGDSKRTRQAHRRMSLSPFRKRGAAAELLGSALALRSTL